MSKQHEKSQQTRFRVDLSPHKFAVNKKVADKNTIMGSRLQGFHQFGMVSPMNCQNFVRLDYKPPSSKSPLQGVAGQNRSIEDWRSKVAVKRNKSGSKEMYRIPSRSRKAQPKGTHLHFGVPNKENSLTDNRFGSVSQAKTIDDRDLNKNKEIALIQGIDP